MTHLNIDLFFVLKMSTKTKHIDGDTLEGSRKKRNFDNEAVLWTICFFFQTNYRGRTHLQQSNFHSFYQILSRIFKNSNQLKWIACNFFNVLFTRYHYQGQTHIPTYKYIPTNINHGKSNSSFFLVTQNQ